MNGKSFFWGVLPLPIAFFAGFLPGIFGLIDWSHSPFTAPVIFLCGSVVTLLLIVLKWRSVVITLPASVLFWLGLMITPLRDPTMVTETMSGCWASGCDACLANTAACGPQHVAATPGDIIAYTIIGGIIIIVGSLFISAINFAVMEIRSGSPDEGSVK